MIDDRIPLKDFEFRIGFHGEIIVSFDEESLIFFYDSETEEEIMRIDPSDLSIIYGVYQQMKKELREEAAGMMR